MEEKYTILDVSEPKTEEEKIKVSNSKVSTSLCFGAAMTASLAVSGYMGLGLSFVHSSIVLAVISGIQGLLSSYGTLLFVRAGIEYDQEAEIDYNEENGLDEESEDKTR